jgi:hypothetical protein
MSGAPRRWAKAFCRFWWDFLVGDTPELFAAMLVMVGVAFALRHERVADVVLLPLLAASSLVASAWRGRVRTRAPREESEPPRGTPETRSP